MPYTLADLPLFLLLPVLLGASGFFSGSETALFGLSARQRYELSRRKDLVGRGVAALFADEQQLLITLMFGNMTVNVLFYVISSALLLKLDPTVIHPLIVAVATLTPLVVVIVFGEVGPKLLANTSAVRWVRVAVVPLYAIHRVIAPVALVLGRWVISPLGRLVAPPRRPAQLSAAELESLIELSRRRGVIGPNEQDVLREVVNLSQTRVRDVMVPRVDIAALDVDAHPRKLRQMIEARRFDCVVAYEGDLDHVAGVIYTRQFLLASAKAAPTNRAIKLRDLVRQVRFVPEQQRLDQLLDAFRRQRTTLAIVVDEYGGTAGLITLKDVVEQMVGDLDMDDAPGETPGGAVERIAQNAWRVSGRLSVQEWADAFDQRIVLPRVATVGGLVMALLGRTPAIGDVATIGNMQLTIEAMSGRRVESVLLTLADAAPRKEAAE